MGCISYPINFYTRKIHFLIEIYCNRLDNFVWNMLQMYFTGKIFCHVRRSNVASTSPRSHAHIYMYAWHYPDVVTWGVLNDLFYKLISIHVLFSERWSEYIWNKLNTPILHQNIYSEVVSKKPEKLLQKIYNLLQE